MRIADAHIAGLQTLGYTAVEARFLYIVATYSGYFVPRQFITFAAVKWGKRSSHFTAKLESRGQATWREYPHLGGVYHLSSKTLFRQIDKENLRNFRRHSIDFIRTRLLLLDFVLANHGYDYLETEPDKLSYFHEQLGVPKELLPAKAYTVSFRCPPVIRYFPDKFPVFLPSPVTFCYIDSGEAGRAGFRHHLNTYKRLLSRLPQARFLYISNSTAHFLRAEKLFRTFVERNLRLDLSGDLRRYFRLRSAWDEKQYGSLSHDDIEWLEQADSRFQGHDTERLYPLWRSGELSDDLLASHPPGFEPSRFCFDCYLVATHNASHAEQHQAGKACFT